MTMMALTRRRHRGLHLWMLALGLLGIGLLGVLLSRSTVQAIPEGDVQFAVTQSPAGGSTVQVGSTLTLDVQATVTNAPVGIPLYFEYDYPAGLGFVSGVSSPPGVNCTDNVPSAGVVRCDYGLVLAGARVPITLTFQVNTSVVTLASQAMIRGGTSDGAPDTAADGSDDTYTGAGAVTVFSPALITAGGSGAPASVFEGSPTTYTATLLNTSGVGTGSFNSALVFTNGIVTGVSCTTSAAPNGAAAGSGTPTATCTASNLGAGETLTITATVAASNTSNGADIAVTLSAPALGISAGLSGVTVDEVGLDSTGGPLTTGQPINVCTGLVPADVPDDAAAGAAQPNNASLIGQSSSNVLLQVADFQVAGPGAGTISAATGCATNQSGVRFTPSVGGSYTVTALYNTGGTNVLALTVGGATNPVPALSLLSPATATAGGPQFTLTVTGSGFVAASTVNWNGSALATTYVSATSLTAIVPAANLASPTSANVTVVTPAPGGGASNALPFTVSAAPNPVPTVSALSPNTIGAGSAQFSMTVTGTNFVAASVVRWDGADLSTSYNSATSLTATVPAAKVAAAGAANVTVFNPAPGGGTSVTPVTFTITASAAKLAFTTQPGAGVAGSALAAQPVVAVQTSSNATVTSDSTTSVTLALNGSGTLTCTGGLSKTAAAGVVTFAGCSVTPAGTGYTITASAVGLTSATSGSFDVSDAPPTTSTQVTVSNPSSTPIPRSRLTFAIGAGSLDASAVSFIIKRKSDGKYFNVTTGDWQTDLVLNAAVHGTGSAWALEIDGEMRRKFAGTVVTLEARVTTSSTVYVNATIPELTIR
jgi:hypothetical protein